MWKTIVAVMAIISSIIAITIYTTRLPEISDNVDANTKAIAENSTYIETIDNALENLQEAFDVLDAKKLYLHSISFVGTNSEKYEFNYISKTQKYNSASEFFNDIPVDFKIYTNNAGTNAYGFYKQSSTYFTRLYMSSGNQASGSYISIAAITSFTDSSYAIN